MEEHLQEKLKEERNTLIEHWNAVTAGVVQRLNGTNAALQLVWTVPE